MLSGGTEVELLSERANSQNKRKIRSTKSAEEIFRQIAIGAASVSGWLWRDLAELNDLANVYRDVEGIEELEVAIYERKLANYLN